MTATDDYVEGLSGTFPLRKSFLVPKLQAAFGKCTIPESIIAKRLDEGAGYLSMIASIKVQWPSDSEGPSQNTRAILKIPTTSKINDEVNNLNTGLDQKTTEDLMETFLKIAHARELVAYEIVGPNTNILMPKIYLAEPLTEIASGGLLLMEDFSDTSTMANCADGLNFVQVGQILDQIAKLQAFSIKNESKWKELVGPFGDEELMKDFNPMMTAALKRMQDDFGMLCNLTDEVLLNNVCDKQKWWQSMNPTSKETCHKVLVHGDLWSNNCLFEKIASTKGGHAKASDKLVAVIDWQCLHPGSCAEDIARLLSSSVTPELRREHTESLLERFHAKLVQELDALEGKPKTDEMSKCSAAVPFTLAQLREEYNALGGFSAAFMLTQFAIMVDGDKYKNDQDARQQIAWRAKANIEDYLLKQGISV